MISLDELCSLLDDLGIPWSNEGFSDDEAIAPPYISLEAGFSETVYADNKAWLSWVPYEILLYTTQRSYELEAKIAHALDQAGCVFEKSIIHLDGDRLIEVSFSVNVDEELGD